MTFEDLRYDQFTFKASHNTIDRAKDHRQWSISDQLSGTGDAIEPVLGLELDIHQVEGTRIFHVKHDADTLGPLLKDTLREIADWSAARQSPGHPIITIHLDLKNAPGEHTEFAEIIDELILEVFPEDRVYRPAEVIGDHEDVIRGARAGGWATFGELRGKVLFCLSGNGNRKHAYANHEPRQRLCFADFGAASRTPPDEGNQAFVNIFVDHQTTLSELETWTRIPGFVVRGYNLVARHAWDVSIDAGLNIVSTDALDNRNFVVSGLGYAPLKNGRRGVPRPLEFGRAREGHRFRNWARTVEFSPGRYIEPKSEAELQEIVRSGAERGGPIRTQGAGHSFSQIMTTSETLISLDNLQGQIGIDGQKVTVPAGIRMKNLIPLLKGEGLALRNMGSVTEQSIAGAISTGTHGTGLTFQSMPTQVSAVRLVDGKGDLRGIDDSEPELLGAARLSLGTLGILTSMTIDCVPYYEIDYDAYLCDFDEGVDQLVSLAEENERMLMWWMLPILPRDKAIIVTKNRKGSSRGSLESAEDLGDEILNKLNLTDGQTIPMDGERLGEALGSHADRSGFRRILHRSGGYEDMLTIPLLPVFHRELEYAVPIEHTKEAMHAIDHIFAEGSVKLNLGCEVRFVKGDSDLLSATGGRDVCYIGVSSLTNAMELFEQIEPMMRDLEGRPHWGKHYNLTRDQISAMYGDNHERFVEIRREFDPKGIFLNNLLRRLFE